MGHGVHIFPRRLLVDKPALLFSIPDSNGEIFKFPPEKGDSVSRDQLHCSSTPSGKYEDFGNLILIYVSAGTCGYTREAHRFRDALTEQGTYKRCDVPVVGVSSDPVEKQKAFIAKHKLPCPVLSDTNTKKRTAHTMGKFGLTDARTTFVIDSKGIVRGMLNATMNFSAHVEFVAKELEQIQTPDAREGEMIGEKRLS